MRLNLSERTGLRLAVALAFASSTGLLILSACGRPDTKAAVGPRGGAALLATSEEMRKARHLMTEAEMKGYVGDDKCVDCHETISASHANSHHVDSFRRVSIAREGPMFRMNQVVTDEVRKINYSTRVEGTECYIVAFDDQFRKDFKADYVIGSAPHGYTFFSDLGSNNWLELRISYFPHLKKWHWTPNQKPEGKNFAPSGITFPADTMAACIHCHATALDGDGTRLDMAKSRLGIGCERCHGPGLDHLEAVEAAKGSKLVVDLKMEKLGEAPAEKVEKLCGDCHGATASSMSDQEHHEAELPRLQAAALERSACYTESKALSCITCHDSHTNVSRDRTMYEKACLGCHSTASKPLDNGAQGGIKTIAGSFKRVECKVKQTKNCITCHMPRKSIPYLGMTSTHHWIKVWGRMGTDD